MSENRYFNGNRCSCAGCKGNCSCSNRAAKQSCGCAEKNCCSNSCVKSHGKHAGQEAHSKVAQKGHEQSKFHHKCGDQGCKDHY